MGTYALIDLSTNIVVNTILLNEDSNWPVPEGFIIVETGEASIGWTYVGGVFYPPPVQSPTNAEIISANTSNLQRFTQIATAQKNALINRVSTLQDAIELEMATPEEIAELPVRQAQLLEWKKYAIFLGRVTLQSGWALTVSWPAQPAAGMDLTVSAVAPGSSQLQ